MVLQALYCRFPKPTKAWSMLWRKTSLTALISTDLFDCMLCLDIPEVRIKIFQLSSSSHEVRSVVTPYRRWFPLLNNESVQAHNEGSSQFDRFGLPSTWKRPCWSRNSEALKCVVLIQNISVSVISFADRRSFIQCSRLT